MSASLDPSVTKRLLFVRFLLRQGVEQSQKPYPLSAASILSLQDAVELFLVVAGQHLGVEITDKMTFEQCFGNVSKELDARDGKQLPKRGAVFEVNKHRVNLKHYGAAPGPQALEDARRAVDAFLTLGTELVFGIDLDEIDLADLVTQQSTADLLRQAADAAASDSYDEAAVLLRAALEELLRDYTARKKTDYRGGPYSFGPTPRLTHPVKVFPPRNGNQQGLPIDLYTSVNKLGEDLMTVSHSTAALQAGLRVLAVGLDFRAYARFSMVTPEVHKDRDGTWQTYAVTRVAPFGPAEYAFCRDFVVDAALRLAELDFDLDLHALARQALADQAQR